MTIYLLPILILFFLFLFSDKLSDKSSQKGFMAVCLLWAIIFAFRRDDVGNDTIGYVDFFMGRGGFYGDIKNVKDIETGFLAFTRIVKSIADSYTLYFSIVAFLLWYMVYKVYGLLTLVKQGITGMLAAFLVADLFVPLMTAFRQTLAIAVLMVGLFLFLRCIEKLKGKEHTSKLKTFAFCGLLIMLSATFFHKSMVLMLPLLILAYYIRMSRKTQMLLITGTVVLNLFFSQDVGNLFTTIFIAFGSSGLDFVNSDVMSIYADEFGENKQKLITYAAWALPALITTYLSKEEDVRTFAYNCFVLSICIFLMFGTSFLIFRINTVLILIGFTQWLPQKALQKTKWKMVYTIFLLALLVKAIVRFNNWPDMDSTIPYYFFWE